MEYWALILFGLIFIVILAGFPVAFTLGGLSLMFGLIFLGPDFFQFMPSRIMGVMNNYVLLAVPLFIFMGIVLERSGLAARLLLAMSRLTGRWKGGLALSVVLVGTLLAASTGIVGATVVTMGLISLPVMLRSGYSPEISSGTIAASGTLGQIIPPSIVLVLLGSVLNVPVGKLFAAALLPGFLLVAAYIVFLFVWFNLGKERINKDIASEGPTILEDSNSSSPVLFAFFLPLVLILVVLGSIFTGIASPTEAAAIGAAGAIILATTGGRLNLDVLRSSMKETMHLTAMVFFILLGASTFALVFRGLGGDRLLLDLILQSQLGAHWFIIILMAVIFIVGFFIDFIEIIFIIIPIAAPILAMYKIDLVWVGILVALNLQTPFLTPPFGFALFYLKGVAPPEVTTKHIYKGVVPFILIQVLILIIVYFFPGILVKT